LSLSTSVGATSGAIITASIAAEAAPTGVGQRREEAIVKIVTLLACIVFLSGCATTPEGMKQLKSSETIVYRMRAEDIDSSALYWGVDFRAKPHESTRYGFKYKRTATIVAKHDEQCEITFSSVITPVSKRGNRPPVESSRTYIFEVDKRKKRGMATVELRPLFEVLRPDPEFPNRKISPPDTLEDAMEVLATSGVFTFQFAMDSSHDSDAITASFKKYCREHSHLQRPVEVMHRTFTTSYILASGDKAIATFYVSLAPKGKGTKTTVITTLRLAPDANYQVDAAAQAADMKRVVSDIVGN
jgi:hypothetical protein